MSKDSEKIFNRQNEQSMILTIKAAAYSYAFGKKLTLYLAILLIICPILVNIVLIFIDNTILNSILSVFSIIVFIIGEFVRNKINKAKFYGAGMQQYFDEYVFSLKNSCRKYISPKKLTLSKRIELVNKYKDKNTAKDSDNFANWYSNYSALPYEQAVYQCQKESIRWDLSIRKKYNNFLKIIFYCVLVLLIINAILQRVVISSLITVISTIVPLFSYFLNSLKKLKADIIARADLYEHIEYIEKNIKSKKDLWDEVEELQVEIFNYRKKAYLIPDWFHDLYEKKLQKEEDDYSKTICDMKSNKKSPK